MLIDVRIEGQHRPLLCCQIAAEKGGQRGFTTTSFSNKSYFHTISTLRKCLMIRCIYSMDSMTYPVGKNKRFWDQNEMPSHFFCFSNIFCISSAFLTIRRVS